MPVLTEVTSGAPSKSTKTSMSVSFVALALDALLVTPSSFAFIETTSTPSIESIAARRHRAKALNDASVM
eukprot:18389-Pelagococcus_subviridis.AAC.2